MQQHQQEQEGAEDEPMKLDDLRGPTEGVSSTDEQQQQQQQQQLDNHRDWIVDRFTALIELRVVDEALRRAVLHHSVMRQLNTLFASTEEKKGLQKEKVHGEELPDGDAATTTTTRKQRKEKHCHTPFWSRHGSATHIRLLFSLPQFSPTAATLTNAHFLCLFRSVEKFFRCAKAEVQREKHHYIRHHARVSHDYVSALACEACERYLQVLVLRRVHNLELLWQGVPYSQDKAKPPKGHSRAHARFTVAFDERCHQGENDTRNSEHKRTEKARSFRHKFRKHKGMRVPLQTANALLARIDAYLTPPPVSTIL